MKDQKRENRQTVKWTIIFMIIGLLGAVYTLVAENDKLPEESLWQQGELQKTLTKIAFLGGELDLQRKEAGAFRAQGMTRNERMIHLIHEGTTSSCCDDSKVIRSTLRNARIRARVDRRERKKEARLRALEQSFEVPHDRPNYRFQGSVPEIGFGLTYPFNRYRYGLGTLHFQEKKYLLKDRNTVQGSTSPPDCMVCVRNRPPTTRQSGVVNNNEVILKLKH